MAVTTFEDMARRTTLNGDGCMVWTGPIDTGGYGRAWIGGKRVLTHRASYEMHRGPIQDGKQIDHLCRNRPCMNPWHLEVVDPVTNTRRGLKGGSIREDGSFACRKCGCTSAKVCSGRGHGGVALRCRSCEAEWARRKHDANKEKINARRRANRAARKEAAK